MDLKNKLKQASVAKLIPNAIAGGFSQVLSSCKDDQTPIIRDLVQDWIQRDLFTVDQVQSLVVCIVKYCNASMLWEDCPRLPFRIESVFSGPLPADRVKEV